MGAIRLIPGGRVREGLAGVQAVPIGRPRFDFDRGGVVTVAFGGQRDGTPRIFQNELHQIGGRRPDPGVTPDRTVSGVEYFYANGVSTSGRYFTCGLAWCHDAPDPGQKRDHHAVSLLPGGDSRRTADGRCRIRSNYEIMCAFGSRVGPAGTPLAKRFIAANAQQREA